MSAAPLHMPFACVNVYERAYVYHIFYVFISPWYSVVVVTVAVAVRTVICMGKKIYIYEYNISLRYCCDDISKHFSTTKVVSYLREQIVLLQEEYSICWLRIIIVW